MHQTKSYRRLVAVAGVFGAVALSACVVTTSSDDNGGAGGTDSAGFTSLGGASAGAPAAGTSGAGAPAGGVGGISSGGTGGGSASTLACDDDPDHPVGTPFPGCVPETVDACGTCIETNCCAEYSQCYGSNPDNPCGSGGPGSGGEFACYQKCLQGVSAMSTGVITAQDQETCAGMCGTSKALNGALECQASVGVATNALIACIGDAKCNTACYGGGD